MTARRLIRNRNAQLRAEGVTREIGYRWQADGYMQRAYFRTQEASEHQAWMLRYPTIARHVYTRDLATGRFIKPTFRAVFDGRK